MNFIIILQSLAQALLDKTPENRKLFEIYLQK